MLNRTRREEKMKGKVGVMRAVWGDTMEPSVATGGGSQSNGLWSKEKQGNLRPQHRMSPNGY